MVPYRELSVLFSMPIRVLFLKVQTFNALRMTDGVLDDNDKDDGWLDSPISSSLTRQLYIIFIARSFSSWWLAAAH